MKAIRLHEFGGPEVLLCEEAPEPTPGPHEVLIRVRAVGVNFADHLTRIGAYVAGDLPIIPGLEAAGIVEALGPEIEGPEVGRPVICWGRRTYAELTVAPDWAVLPIPEGMPFEQAAAVPIAFGTAWHALTTMAATGSGERVLVHAAGSGVGSASIQVAKQLGCWVVATAGQDWKLDRARELGADAAVNYTTQDVAQEVKRLTDGCGVDVVLEGVGRATFPGSVRSLASDGRLVLYGAPSGPRMELDARIAISRNLTLLGMSVTTGRRFPETVRSFAQQVLPWFTDGRLQPIVDRVYPLEEVAAAHQRMIDRAHFGKLVLTVEG